MYMPHKFVHYRPPGSGWASFGELIRFSICFFIATIVAGEHGFWGGLAAFVLLLWALALASAAIRGTVQQRDLT
jgi:hypothetical protein